MNLSAIQTSVIRYLASLLGGVIIWLLLHLGLDQFSGQAAAIALVIVVAVYGAVVRIAEKRFPIVGHLLGVVSPTYAKPAAIVPSATYGNDPDQFAPPAAPVVPAPVVVPEPAKAPAKKAPAKKAPAKKAAAPKSSTPA